MILRLDYRLNGPRCVTVLTTRRISSYPVVDFVISCYERNADEVEQGGPAGEDADDIGAADFLLSRSWGC